MAQSTIVCLALVAVLSVLGAQAQNPCQSIQGMQNLNATKLGGYWYEVARAPAAKVACIQVHAVVANNDTQLNITTIHSSSPTSTYMNQQSTATVYVGNVNANTGFNLTYSGNNAPPTTTYKILDTDYSSYLVVCGYTSTNTSSSFGAVLTTNRAVNQTLLGQIVANTSQILTNFNTTTVGNVTQSNCYASSASTSLPMLTTIFAAFFFLVKFVN